MKLRHGGELIRASQEFGNPLEEWIDLSTGISPMPYPIGVVPQSVWHSLPDEQDQLMSAAASYYGCSVENILAVPGSQFAIQFLPGLLVRSTVAIPRWGYEEHRYWWQQAGHQIRYYHSYDELSQLVENGDVRNVVVINPNNPTAEVIESARLQKMQWILAGRDANSQRGQRSGYLVVDEAFVDTAPEISLASCSNVDGLVVLRSVGKFFGLAGIRLGFVMGSPTILAALTKVMPRWGVSHPARWVGVQALKDKQWQAEQRLRLATSSREWLDFLVARFEQLEFQASPLFVSGFGDPQGCRDIYQKLAECGLLIRLFDGHNGVAAIRFGLPPVELTSRIEKIFEEVQDVSV